ncbi:MAG: pseudouridine synthase [Pseudomonadota bacterium]
MGEIRLSKLMAQRGMCSRREADRFIERGWVLVDGEPVTTLGIRVDDTQVVELSEQAAAQQAGFATVLLNKPVGLVSGLPEDGHQSAIMLIESENAQNTGERAPNRHGLAPAGRLDIDSMGLIVFTKDGRIAKQLIGENSAIEKEYLVWARGNIDNSALSRLRSGLTLDGKPLKNARVEHLKGSQLRFVLTEGRKRQIRRMCEQVELQVTRLIRVRIGNVMLADLPVGKWRLLRAGETF